jgi:hypothetical protein
MRNAIQVHDVNWYLDKRTMCQSCGYSQGNIAKCIYCDMEICAGCVSDGQFCVRCLNNDNSIDACNDWINTKKKTRVRWFKIDTNTGDIIPVKKRWWMKCFY